MFSNGEISLTWDSIVTITGTLVTLLGMGVTIWQVTKARNYKDQIKFDIRKINLTNIADRLKRAQDEIRRLPTSSQTVPRGIRPRELIHKTREHFDIALSSLNTLGPDASVRALIVEAQRKLNSYEISWNSGNPNPQDVHDLQANMQDIVSTMSSTIYQME